MSGGTPRRVVLVALLALPLALAGCAPGGLGAPRYIPANAGVDPYATMRRKAEELFQEGLARERRKEWREALRNYEQARLWDPDNRADIAGALAHARSEAGQLAFAPPAPTATLQPVPPRGGSALPVPAASPTAGTGAGARTSPTPVPTAVASAPAGYRTFRSKIYPYSIAYPADWVPKPGASGAGEDSGDTFVAPAGRAQAAVMVNVQQLRAGVTLDQFYLLTTRQLQEEGVSILGEESRTVAGYPAYAITYRLQRGADNLAVRHVLFVNGNWGWGVLLVATPGTTPELLKVYGAMLDSLDVKVAPDQVQ